MIDIRLVMLWSLDGHWLNDQWRSDFQFSDQSDAAAGGMDADNRVVLNCGGIRHEVYKVVAIQILANHVWFRIIDKYDTSL